MMFPFRRGALAAPSLYCIPTNQPRTGGGLRPELATRELYYQPTMRAKLSRRWRVIEIACAVNGFGLVAAGKEVSEKGYGGVVLLVKPALLAILELEEVSEELRRVPAVVVGVFAHASPFVDVPFNLVHSGNLINPSP